MFVSQKVIILLLLICFAIGLSGIEYTVEVVSRCNEVRLDGQPDKVFAGTAAITSITIEKYGVIWNVYKRKNVDEHNQKIVTDIVSKLAAENTSYKLLGEMHKNRNTVEKQYENHFTNYKPSNEKVKNMDIQDAYKATHFYRDHISLLDSLIMKEFIVDEYEYVQGIAIIPGKTHYEVDGLKIDVAETVGGTIFSFELDGRKWEYCVPIPGPVSNSN